MQRNRFFPWFIGLAIIVVADGYLLYFRTDEGAAGFAQQTAMAIIPIVALGLMFLTFESQRWETGLRNSGQRQVGWMNRRFAGLRAECLKRTIT